MADHTCWSTALENGTTIQPVVTAVVAEQMVRETLSSSALSPDHHSSWIAPKCSDILLNPTQGKPLIQQSGIAGSLGQQARCLQKSPHAQSIIHTNGNDGLVDVLAHLYNAAEVVLLGLLVS